ncbi:MAG: peptidoglycan recognition family protein [Bacteroidota bacterium]
MPRHRAARITIHHTATYQNPNRTIEDKLRGLQAFSQRADSLGDGRLKRAWADVPYHFYIDVHGQIAEGREVGYPGDTNTAYDPTGHVLIVLEGNFEEEELNDQQRTSLFKLTRALAAHWRIPPERIGAHRDFAETLCPGQGLYDWLPELRAALSQEQPGLGLSG